MSEEKKIEELGKIMMRIFFMQQIQLYNLDDLKDYAICPKVLKPDIGKCKVAIIGLKGTAIKYLPPDTDNLLRQELSSERAHDLNMIFDQLHKIENLGEVYNWLVELTEKAAK